MKKFLFLTAVLLIAITALGCQQGTTEQTSAEAATNEEVAQVKETAKEVNIYTDRHYDTDQDLFDKFQAETGIKVNVVKAKSDELIERLKTEGAETEADLLITSDVGRLYRAKSLGLLKPFESELVESNIPQNLKDAENNWVALTMRARIIAYSKDRVTPDMLSTYEDLTDNKWQGKILVRSSGNIYNQSLLASFIALNGDQAAEEWASGILANMARTPKGNDRDQMKAVVAGEGDLAIVNTYYVGKLLNSSDELEVEVGNKIGVFFPNQETNGTHVNISGAGLTLNGKNTEAAIELLEYLTSEQAQEDYANANYEYPANSKVEPSALLKSFGAFNAQEIDLSLLGANNTDAVKIFNKIGWQ